METTPPTAGAEQEQSPTNTQFDQLLVDSPAEAVTFARNKIELAAHEHDSQTLSEWRLKEQQARINEIKRLPDSYSEADDSTYIAQWVDKMSHIYNELTIWRKDNGLIPVEPEYFRLLVVKLARAQSAIGHRTEFEDLKEHYQLTNQEIDGQEKAA